VKCHRIFGAVGAGIACLILSRASAEPGPEAGYHRYYWKERVELRLDSSRLAILQIQGRLALQRGVPALGIAPEQMRAWPIAGWSLAPAVGAARGEGQQDVEARIEALLQDGTIDFASPVFLDDDGNPLIITPDVLIAFDPNLDGAEARAILENAAPGAIIEAGYGAMPGVYRLRGAARSGLAVLNIANAMALRDDVRYAEPDLIFTGRGGLIPNDFGFGNCWGLHNTGQFGGTADADMDAPEAWDITTGDPAIKVVIIDTGVQQDHPDINQVAGVDVTTDAGDGGPVNQFDFHGTPVAGCVSAIINNGIGTVGVAPACVSASARTFIGTTAQGNWTSQSTWTVDTLTWAEMIGARVTNNSNQYGSTASAAIDDKYAQTRADGMVHFASAGNGASTFITYPASLGPVNGVAALHSGGALASFSNRGVGLDFSAPGEFIYTTSRGSTYGFWSGTSFASPYTAGVAALALSMDPSQTAADVEAVLQASCHDLGSTGYDTDFGWGFVNAFDAVSYVSPASAPDAFSLISPPNGAVDVGRRPTLTWQKARLAFSYRVQIDDNSDFSSPAVDLSGVVGESFDCPTTLDAMTTYFWRVIAENPVGATNSIETRTFIPLVSPPGAFALTSPPPGQTGVGLMPTLIWQPSPRAESYAVTLDDNADFSSPLADIMTSLSQYAYPGSLGSEATYHWRVIASNPIGNTASTPGSATFQTIGTPPGSFNLLSPPDGPNVNTLTPTLSWGASAGADSYRVILDDTVDLSSPVHDVSGVAANSYMVPGGVLQDLTRYYWRIVAINNSGETISSPATRSFGVVNAPPPCFGDANGDGEVSFFDVLSVLANFGSTGPAGDADHNGIVNFIDVLNVLANFGSDCT